MAPKNYAGFLSAAVEAPHAATIFMRGLEDFATSRPMTAAGNHAELDRPNNGRRCWEHQRKSSRTYRFRPLAAFSIGIGDGNKAVADFAGADFGLYALEEIA